MKNAVFISIIHTPLIMIIYSFDKIYYREKIWLDIGINGDISIKERSHIKEQLKKSDHYLMITTSQLSTEAFDLPSLNTTFITMPMRYEGRVTQSVGRLHRQYKDNDYVDSYVKQLDNMFKEELKAYKKRRLWMSRTNKYYRI